MLGGAEWTWTDEDKEGNGGIIKGGQEELEEIVLVAPEEVTAGAIIVVEEGKEISEEEEIERGWEAISPEKIQKNNNIEGNLD
ncbi:hypothetical protein EJD97_021112 [Solanum chilense]|uniref:Uncharacterized protein n=1 Tax=Solanum chilense TaxID=4083 RepID=A0A6N2CCM5_SOLCI|nr:hypothetical protein EJD97_021112 [Solanum chilense]